ncbi:MAG TPA: bifunctional phosphopantothenoylcysteine decarboxylase/phosphopantothenate--cysteine ligase CoaBC [Desulfonatronum sp.]|nr:bifunctional phosphopantothenoylcysteine decarboxylase/phosphopantothenate--cysteine ligase CoaBC [Desulfonatronum sp.]
MILPHTDFTGFSCGRVHLGVTGSVSAYRAIEIMRRLQRAGLSVSVTLTSSAQEFIQPLQFRSLTEAPVYEALFARDQAEFAHLYPAGNCRSFLVAPCTANILAKHAHGLADDLLSTQLLAFTSTIIHAPAMNPRLWHSFAVQNNISILRDQGICFVEPETGLMACGESGTGRLASTEEIFLTTLKSLMPQDLSGLRVLVNLGPTQEPFDPVRYLTNPSSGIMGASIAIAAWLRGAAVTVISGPVSSLWFPRFITPIYIQTAQEMHQACLDHSRTMNIICLTAAVCDFRFKDSFPDKVKKTSLDQAFSLPMGKNPDILADIGRQKKSGQILIGFAAETSDPTNEARRKLQEKNLDMIVANRIDLPNSGFRSPMNQVMVLDRHGRVETWPTLPKSEISLRLFDWVFHAFVDV